MNRYGHIFILAISVVASLAGCSTPGKPVQKGGGVYQCAEEKIFASTAGRRSTLDFLKASISSNACPELMSDILKTESSEDIYTAEREFGQFVLERISFTAEMMKGQYLDEHERNPLEEQLKVVSQFNQFLKEKCSLSSEGSKACNAKDDFFKKMARLKTDVDKLVQQEALDQKEQSYRSSPEGLIDQACACDKFIAGHERAIKREKEIAAVSATANIAILNSAGSQIVDLKEIKKNIIEQYKATTGRNLTNYKCTDIEELTNPLMWSSGTPVRTAK